jgi:hypothetical protein
VREIDWGAAELVASYCGPGTQRLVWTRDMNRLELWLPWMAKVATPEAAPLYAWLSALILEPDEDVVAQVAVPAP